MVVYAVAEPYLLEVFLESFELRAFAVTFVAGVDIFKKLAYLKVVTSVLVPDYVATHLCGLSQIIEHLFLAKREAVELGYFISEYFDVGEAVHMIVEVLVDCGN